MNKGFAYYFKKSNSIYSFVNQKQKFVDKLALWLYVLAAFIGKLIFFIRPIFLISEQNLANMFINGHSFSISKSFQGVKEKYFKLLIVELIQFAIAAAVLISICVALAFPVIVSMKPVQPDAADISFIGIIFIIVGAILFLVSSIIISLRLGFVSYVASKSKDLDVSDYLFNSNEAAKKSQMTLLGSVFVYYIISTIPLVLTIALGVGISLSSMPIQILEVLLSLVFAFGIIVVYVLLFAPFMIKHQIFIHLLAQDVCSTNKRIVVKRVASTSLEYEPLFDADASSEGIDIKK